MTCSTAVFGAGSRHAINEGLEDPVGDSDPMRARAAGNSAVGAAIGGPEGRIGGYLLGDRIFRNDPGKK